MLSVPKCLAPVHDSTFLELQIKMLGSLGIQNIVLSLGYGADKIIPVIEYLTSHIGIQARYIIEPEPLGTGGAIKHCMTLLAVDEALVINGDTYLDLNDLLFLDPPLDFSKHEMVRMTIMNVEDRRRYGGVQLSSNGRVSGFTEKGEDGQGLINAGLYRINKNTFLPDDINNFSFENLVLPRVLRNESLFGVRVEGRFIDIGVPSDYEFFVNRWDL